MLHRQIPDSLQDCFFEPIVCTPLRQRILESLVDARLALDRRHIITTYGATLVLTGHGEGNRWKWTVLVPMVTSTITIRASTEGLVDTARDHWTAVHHDVEQLQLLIVQPTKLTTQLAEVGGQGGGIRRGLIFHVLIIYIIST
jgi:hypothetical protein